MTEAEWLACEDPSAMLDALRLDCRADIEEAVTPVSRKSGLLLTACSRHFEHALIDPRSLCALAVFEQYLDGGATEAERQEAEDDANAAVASDGLSYGQFAAAATVCSALFTGVKGHRCIIAEPTIKAAQRAAGTLASDGMGDSGAELVEAAYQAALLRDIFGNPFRPVTFSPDWRTDTAIALAKQMYDSRDFGAMQILADALQEAGCDNNDILNHCRDANQVHVRGCWVVDLVLGKE